MADGPPPRKRILYGRRHGHRLRQVQKARFERLLPGLAVHLPREGDLLEPERLFHARPAEIWLEIGFGAGEHLAWQARAHPEIGFLGCEPFVNGIAGLLKQIEEGALQNVRIFPDDARLLLAALPTGSVGRVFLLFPDPWPKKRHHKRRFVTPENLDVLARVMREGAELRLATDDPDYVRWMLRHALAHPDFAWEAKGPGAFRQRPADWPATRYEAKAAQAGRRAAYLRFRRLAAAPARA
ncbi:MAG: tRNA (guanosine(46)-N7)-methyltransferase TrmB [Pseudomonadota bacterium]